MLSALNDAGVDYLIVGAYALAAHGNVRATGYIDIWVRPTIENAQKVWQALGAFRAPRRDVTPQDLCDPEVVYQIGLAPTRIDILTAIDGVTFDEAWPNRLDTILSGVRLAVIGREDLLVNKKASGRPKDMADAAWLEEHDLDRS